MLIGSFRYPITLIMKIFKTSDAVKAIMITTISTGFDPAWYVIPICKYWTSPSKIEGIIARHSNNYKNSQETGYRCVRKLGT